MLVDVWLFVTDDEIVWVIFRLSIVGCGLYIVSCNSYLYSQSYIMWQFVQTDISLFVIMLNNMQTFNCCMVQLQSSMSEVS